MGLRNGILIRIRKKHIRIGNKFDCVEGVSPVIKVGLGILQITSAKRCPQVWPCFGRSLFSTDFVEFDPAV